MKKVVLALSALALIGCTEVDSNEAAFKKVFGKIDPELLSPGLEFYNPFSTDIVKMDLRERAFNLPESESFTKDTQNSKITVSGTAVVERSKVVEVYSTLGQNWEQVAVIPVILGSLKTVVGGLVADELVARRGELRDKVLLATNEALAERGIRVVILEVANINFSDEYEKAVEAKSTAYQAAQAAKNKTVQIEEEARQKIVSAKAEAESMSIKTEALSKNRGLVEWESVQKWNGVLPQYMMGSTVPFINLDKK